ncbi:MAG: hypothetical protein KatS3mg124_1015 [Porticoccaceae bacterium]|nr:MAG: hypothetical protein KatS3mg124_1015 [Porticoccaceae bacterium]
MRAIRDDSTADAIAAVAMIAIVLAGVLFWLANL